MQNVRSSLSGEKSAKNTMHMTPIVNAADISMHQRMLMAQCENQKFDLALIDMSNLVNANINANDIGMQ